MGEETAPADNGYAMLQLYTFVNYLWIMGTVWVLMGAVGLQFLTIPITMALTFPILLWSQKAQREVDKRSPVSVE